LRPYFRSCGTTRGGSRFDFPRSQIALLGFVILLLLYWQFDSDSRWHGATAALLTVGTVYQLWELSAYTPFRRVQALPNQLNEPERRIRVLTANVLMPNENVAEYLEIDREARSRHRGACEPDSYWEHSSGYRERSIRTRSSVHSGIRTACSSTRA
jgi:hypothetical protein